MTDAALTLRTAMRKDAEFLLRLEEDCMRAYAEALWGGWRPRASAATLELAGHQIIEQTGQSVGCIATKDQSDYRVVDKLYITPAFQSQGIGAVILGRITKAASANGKAVRLTVLATNPAVKFYLREGFEVEKQTAERIHMLKLPCPD